MEGMSSQLKELWEQWELRVLVLLSLAVQVLLIVLGRHRKYRPNLWLQPLVWSLYLLADAVAIYALGKIATRLEQMRQDLGAAAAAGLDRDAQMIAFWAPFLLLHLGGLDTITAYSLEDNELWRRHLLRLLVQMVGTLVIFFQALTGSDLWVLSLLIIVSGLIKYGERVYVLWAASSEQFRDSTPDPPLHCPRILEEYMLKKAEGYDIMPHEVIQVGEVNGEDNSKGGEDLWSCDETILYNGLKEKRKHEQGGEERKCCNEMKGKQERGGQENNCGNDSKRQEEDGVEKSKCGESMIAAARGTFEFFQRLFGDKSLFLGDMSKRNRAELALAKDLIDTFRRLFTDLVLSVEERNACRLKLLDKSFHVVFRVIEIELGFMYDLLYTKAMVIRHRWGFTLRSVSILATGLVLVLFSLSDKEKYSKFDVSMTFLLLSVALFLEIYSLFYLLFSDEAAYWLKVHRSDILDFVERLQPLYYRRRWSGSMGQYNLLSFALKEKHLRCHQILEWLHLDQKVLKFLYKDDVKVESFLKKRILDYFKSQAKSEMEDLSVWDHRGDLILKRGKFYDLLKWSIVDIGFDQSILAWHIATELLCHPKDPNSLKNPPFTEEHVRQSIILNSEMSKQLSRYMLYLLVMYPSLLPIGVGRVKFRETYLEVMNFFTEQKLIQGKSRPKAHPHESVPKIAEACRTLRKNVDPHIDPIVAKGDKSKWALYQGRLLAWQLSTIADQVTKWETISLVWVEMLAYAAVKCKGHQHAQQLPQGGEFLTHVWLLMAHFGLTDHFQIPHAPEIAELLVKLE